MQVHRYIVHDAIQTHPCVLRLRVFSQLLGCDFPHFCDRSMLLHNFEVEMMRLAMFAHPVLCLIDLLLSDFLSPEARARWSDDGTFDGEGELIGIGLLRHVFLNYYIIDFLTYFSKYRYTLSFILRFSYFMVWVVRACFRSTRKARKRGLNGSGFVY